MSNHSEPMLGAIIPNNAVVGRDAIHIAVCPVIAGEDLKSGNIIALDNGGNVAHLSTISNKAIGIVDPYLGDVVINKSERFWCFLFPRTIISLRHVWEHPDFPSEVIPELSLETKKSQDWMNKYSEELGFSVEKILSRTTDWIKKGETWSEGDTFEMKELPDEFWTHYEILTGIKVSKDKKENFFRCSC